MCPIGGVTPVGDILCGTGAVADDGHARRA
jgi:hypothetical protein